MKVEDRRANFLSLVSRGFTLKAARTQSGYTPEMEQGNNSEIVKSGEATKPGQEEEAEKGQLRAQLADLGINPAPNAKLETLKKRFAKAQKEEVEGTEEDNSIL